MDGYKVAHEAFMADHAGTTVGKVIACLAHAPAFLWLLKTMQGHSGSQLWRDFLVVVIPTLFAITILFEYLYITGGLIYGGIILYFFVSWRRASSKRTPAGNDESHWPNSHSLTTYLTHFKGMNVLLTCLSILAVDFPVFPRVLAKTETFGLSLMDAGVGTFIVSSAITSKYARGSAGKPEVSRDGSGGCKGSYSLQHIMVLCLGVGRFVVLKALNYQEHVSEYGIHWNFFVTLFCVWTLADVLHVCLPRPALAAFAVAVLGAYQALLLHTPLTAFMMSSVRVGLVAANKEGIVSLLGYVPLYLITECIAHCLFYAGSGSGGGKPAATYDSSPDSSGGSVEGGSSGLVDVRTNRDVVPAERECGKPRWDVPLMKSLAAVSILLWLGWWASSSFVQPTSRRLVNAAYVLLVLALCATMILCLYVVETSTQGAAVPVLSLQYLSKHSLVVFLAANVLTGAVNVSMQTIYASDALALGVLAGYALAVTGVAWLAEYVSVARANKLRT